MKVLRSQQVKKMLKGYPEIRPHIKILGDEIVQIELTKPIGRFMVSSLTLPSLNRLLDEKIIGVVFHDAKSEIFVNESNLMEHE